MYKKIISVMSVALVVFLCSSFPVFAVTSGGKTIVSSSYSYNDGDVTLYTRVNGHFSDTYYSGGERPYVYEHVFTVTIANNTNEFQVASTNGFTVDLYTGYTDTFASTTTNTPSGSSMYRPSWGSEVTSYSANMTAPRVLMYPSGDNAGHVLISFSDSDLLVLNPNETRTYNFTINFLMLYDGAINDYPINGNAMYSYFTYAGSVSMYSRPTGFSSNIINDFMANNSLPDSVIAYLMANYDLLSEDPAYQNFFNNYTLGQGQYSGNKNFSRSTSEYGEYVRLYSPGFRIVSSDYDLYNVINETNSGNHDLIGAFDLYVNYQLYATGTEDILVNPANATVDWIPQVTLNGWSALGSEVNVLQSHGFQLLFATPYAYDNNHRFLTLGVVDSTHDTGRARVATFDPSFITVKYTYYFGISDTSLNNVPTAPVFSNLAIANFSTQYNSHRSNETQTHTIIWYLRNWWSSYVTNQPAADDLNDNSEDVSDTVGTQHETEASYFEDSQSAINDTGIQNFQFDSNTLGGLNGLKDDFTAVWTSCGTLAQYWIASLTIGLALSIIRHRRMFSHD